MSKHLGNLPHGDTIPLLFDTFGGSGESITITGLALADIKVYMDGGVTQRSSTAGFTLLDTDGIDFDGITGIHGISLDTSDDTDAGFWAVGSYYDVVIDSITVGGQTVSFHVASWRLVHAESEAGVPKVDVDQLNGDTSALGILQSIYNTIASQWRVADSGTTTTLTDCELTSADTDDFVGSLVFFLGGANKNRARLITGFDPATNTITFTPALPDVVTIENYTILPFGAANVEQWLGSSPNNAIADAILDRADGIETGLTFRQAMRLGTAVWTGKVSGAGTGTEVFRNAVADSKARVTATVDALGNRTAITYDAD